MHCLIKVKASGKILQSLVLVNSSISLGLKPARTSKLLSWKIEKDSPIDFALTHFALVMFSVNQRS